MPRRFVAYLRVSTDKQADSGFSLASQAQVVQDYALNTGMLPVEDGVYEEVRPFGPDLAIRAHVLRRCDAERLVLVVASIDRLSRDSGDLHSILARAHDNGWQVHSVREGSDPRALLAGAAWAGQERRRIAERTSAAMRAMSAAGLYTGGAVPYGYRVAADGRLVAEPAEGAVLEAARALRAAGWSLRAVGAELARRGRLPRSGGAWSAGAVARLVDADLNRPPTE